MSKKFSKRQLLDHMDFCQRNRNNFGLPKKLPILIENDNTEGFCVNARKA